MATQAPGQALAEGGVTRMSFIGMNPEPLTPRGRLIVFSAVILALIFIALMVTGIVLILHNPGQGTVACQWHWLGCS